MDHKDDKVHKYDTIREYMKEEELLEMHGESSDEYKKELIKLRKKYGIEEKGDSMLDEVRVDETKVLNTLKINILEAIRNQNFNNFKALMQPILDEHV